MHGWLIAGSLRAVEGGKTEWTDKGQRGYYDLEGKALTVRAHPVVQQRQGGESKVDDNPILERYTVVGADAAEDVPCMDKDLVLVLQTESEGQLVLFAGKKKDASKWRAALKYAVSKERVFPESGPGVQRWLSRMRKAIKAGRLTEQAITDMFEREPMAAERVLDNSQGGTMLHVAARCSAALVGGDFTPPEKKPPPAEGVEERDLDIFFEYSDSQPEEEEAAEEPPKPRSLFELIYDACPESAEAKDDLGQTPLHIMASTNARHWRPIRWLSQVSVGGAPANNQLGNPTTWAHHPSFFVHSVISKCSHDVHQSFSRLLTISCTILVFFVALFSPFSLPFLPSLSPSPAHILSFPRSGAHPRQLPPILKAPSLSMPSAKVMIPKGRKVATPPSSSWPPRTPPLRRRGTTNGVPLCTCWPGITDRSLRPFDCSRGQTRKP